jgi:hypothetical protein
VSRDRSNATKARVPGLAVAIRPSGITSSKWPAKLPNHRIERYAASRLASLTACGVWISDFDMANRVDSTLSCKDCEFVLQTKGKTVSDREAKTLQILLGVRSQLAEVPDLDKVRVLVLSSNVAVEEYRASVAPVRKPGKFTYQPDYTENELTWQSEKDGSGVGVEPPRHITDRLAVCISGEMKKG